MSTKLRRPPDRSVLDPHAIEDAELDLLLEGVYRLFGYDFREYARTSVKRRLSQIVAKEQLHNLSELQGRLLRDHKLLQTLASALSIQVSSFFRDAEFYLAFRRKAVPLLRTYPSVRLWHAGCATGEEVYSMAIVLFEENLLNKCRIYATDVNEDALEAASRAVYRVAHVQGAEQNYIAAGGHRSLKEYFQIEGGEARVMSRLKERITFHHHNLVTDTIFNEFNAVFCRNVLIYFSKPLQNRVHELLYGSLVRFGILGLGANETIHLTPKEKHFKCLDETARLYRRID
jgi:chemotaxis protein methyltransferase CheR